MNLTHTDGWRDATGYDRQAGSLRWDRAGRSWSWKTLATFGHVDQQTAGTSTLQYRTHLDGAETVLIKPDFVWSSERTPRIVVDAKYKAESPETRWPYFYAGLILDSPALTDRPG